jgi:endonuclease/exonuclease/phosphatase (EEP) superfamily protein YafD
MTAPQLRVVAWNAEWAPPRGVRGRRVAELLAGQDADVIVLTEGHRDLLPPGGHVGESQAPLDAPIEGARRVLLWSRGVLSRASTGPDLPHQAFAGATVGTPLGKVDVMAVCIPWADAGVARFGGTRARWEEHEAYLGVLGEMLRARTSDRPLIVAGDFNQYVPRTWGPERLGGMLLATFDGMTFATEGSVPGVARQVIDHVVHTSDLEVRAVAGWEGRDHDDRPMSDHSGVRVDLHSAARQAHADPG